MSFCPSLRRLKNCVAQGCQHRSETRRKLPDWNPRFFRVHRAVFFRNQRQRFFLLQTWAKSLPGPPGQLEIRFDNHQADTGSMIRRVSGEVGFQTGRFGRFSRRR